MRDSGRKQPFDSMCLLVAFRCAEEQRTLNVIIVTFKLSLKET